MAALVAAAASLLNQVLVIKETVFARRSLQDPDRFADRFAALLASVKARRLVIVVDNLDRCAPDKAVEMLSTIKTYLEPTVQRDHRPASRSQRTVQKEVVFVVALDDQALRRHLIAQEAGPSANEHERRQAETYVDEYLAKFFGARLPIRPILRGDIRTYIEEHLDPLIKARGYEEQRQQLVQLVSAALRRNPRHVKQFMNDLETRIRLLQERETAPKDGQPGIASPISGDIMMIAKLSLLESEWPRAFAMFQREPGVLKDWHRQAESNREVWFDGQEDDTPEGHAAAQAFAAFLQASRTTSSIHLRAFVNLKQSKVEAGLPGFAEFHEAVVNEDRAEVEKILDDLTAEERKKFAENMPELVQDELEDGFDAGARAGVGMMVSVEGLSQYEKPRTEVLKVAVDNAGLLVQLDVLDPEPLIEASRSLSVTDRHKVFDRVVERFAGENKTDAERGSASDALSLVATELRPGARSRISNTLTAELAGKFELFARLVEADPTLLSTPVIQAALEALDQPDPDGLTSLVGRDAAFAVAKAGAAELQDPAVAEGAVDLVIRTLAGTQGNPEALSITAKRALELIGPIEAMQDNQWVRLAQEMPQQWGNYPAEARAEILRLWQMAVQRGEESASDSLAAALSGTIFADPNEAVRLLLELEADGLVRQLVGPVVEQLTNVARQHAAERVLATELVIRLAPDEAPQRLSQILLGAVEQGQAEAALELANQHKELVRAEGVAIAEEVLGWCEQQPAETALPYPLLSRLSEYMDQSQQERFGQLIASRIEGGDDSAANALANLGPSDEAFGLALSKAVEVTLAHPESSGRGQHLLAAIAPNVGELSDDDQLRLVNHLRTWLLAAAPPEHAGIASEIRKMTGLRAKAAEPLVMAGIDVVRPLPPATQENLLVAVGSVSGGRNTRASRRLYAYLQDELGEQSEEHEQMAARVIQAIGGP